MKVIPQDTLIAAIKETAEDLEGRCYVENSDRAQTENNVKREIANAFEMLIENIN